MKFVNMLLILFIFSITEAKSQKNQKEIDNPARLSYKVEILNKRLDSIKTELIINRALIEADKQRATDTIKYSSSIVQLSGWIMTFLGVIFVILGFFGFKEVKNFRTTRKKMSNLFYSNP